MFDKTFFHLAAGFLALLVVSFAVIVMASNYDAVFSPAENIALPAK